MRNNHSCVMEREQTKRKDRKNAFLEVEVEFERMRGLYE